MPTLRFTTHLVRHRPAPMIEAAGETVAEVLARGLAGDDLLRSPMCWMNRDVCANMSPSICDGEVIADRVRLTDPVGPKAEIYVLQALSGG